MIIDRVKYAQRTKLNTFSLFAYGTLRTNQPESGMFRSKLIESKPAKMLGRLYQLKEGYPILYTSPKFMICEAGENYLLDWREYGSTAPMPPPLSPDPYRWIEGELLTFPLESDVFEKIDAWEGFTPGKDSFYQRIMTQAYASNGQSSICWAYVCLTEPGWPSRPIIGNRWLRPKGLRY